MRRVLVVLGCAVAVALLACRVEEVNSQRVVIPVEQYESGEWLELDDAFLSTKSIENCQGYAIRVDGAEVMTPNDYLRRYGVDGVQSSEYREADEPVVIAVTMTIRNNSNMDGGLMSWQWRLVPDSNASDFRISGDLFQHVQPEVGENLNFRIADGQEYTTVFPFVGQRSPRYFEDSAIERLQVVEDDSFRINVTNIPVQKRLKVTLG